MNGTAQRPRTPAPRATPRAWRSPRPWTTGSPPSPGQGALGALLSPSPEEQVRRGYGHTLREIAQQPVTWIETAAPHAGAPPRGRGEPCRRPAVVFTGSGSSIYAAECVAPCLQRGLGVPVSAVPAGLILTHPETCLPPTGPFLVVSLARSGNSPESRAVVDWLLESRPQARHLFITCNRDGALATSYRDRPDVRTIVLDEKTDDRSLVMTSSFTNLVLAGRALGGQSPRPARRAPSASRVPPPSCCGSGPTPSPRPRGAASAPSSTSAAAAAWDPPARPRSRCWR